MSGSLRIEPTVVRSIGFKVTPTTQYTAGREMNRRALAAMNVTQPKIKV